METSGLQPTVTDPTVFSSVRVHRTVGVALCSGLFILELSLDPAHLARRLRRLEARHVPNRLLHLSDCVLDISSYLTINEPKSKQFRGEEP